MILHDKEAARHFVAGILGMKPEDFGECNGLIVGETEIVAAVVYHDYHIYEHGKTIQASIASISPKWATKNVLKVMFAYPFEEIGVTCLRVCCRRGNRKARQFVKRLGFKEEGVARREWDGIEDVVSYSMFPEECVWIGGQLKTRRPHGGKDRQGYTESTAAA